MTIKPIRQLSDIVHREVIRCLTRHRDKENHVPVLYTRLVREKASFFLPTPLYVANSCLVIFCFNSKDVEVSGTQNVNGPESMNRSVL